MKMEHYLSHTDYLIWKVIQNGNGHVFVTTDTNGLIKVLPLKTAKEVMAREMDRKARTTLLMALPKNHLAKFHKMADAKEMWEAIKSRFEGLHKGYDRFQTLLSQLEIHGAGRSLPSSWSQVALIMRTKPGLDTLSFDDLYNTLRVFKRDVKGTTASSSNTQNVAFVSVENTSSINDVSTAYSVSSPSVSKSQKEGSLSYTDEVIHSFFANQSSAPQLDYNDLEQINDDHMEEMDLKWQVAMISMRIKKVHKRTGRKLQFDTKDPVSFGKTKVECFNCHKIRHFARDWRAKGNQDSRRRDARYNGNKTRDNGQRPAYQEDSKALVTIDGEDIDWSGHVEEDAQNYAMMAYSSSNRVLKISSPSHDKNYMPSGPDAKIDHFKFTYGPKQTLVNESDSKPSEYASCESDSSVETSTSMPEPVENASNVVCKPKVWTDAPIIEEYESDSDNDSVSNVQEDKEKPSFAFTDSVKHVKTSRENIKETSTTNHSPRIEKHDRNDHTRKGLGYAFTRKACFVCGSFSHLVRDCDFHEKRMVKQAELTKSKNKVTGQRENRPVWNNVQRVNHQNKFIPLILLTKTDDPHRALKDKGVVNSGCSRHMTRNKAHLADYQEFKGGSVTIGGSNERITATLVKGRLIEFTMSNTHQELASPEANGFCKELASPKQMDLGKDISNPLMDGRLPKTTLPTSKSYNLYIMHQAIWTMANIKTINDEVRIQALIDEKRVNIKESSIHHTLKLDNVEGTSCLANAEIFHGLAKMGYEKQSEKLTFYKAFFSAQWKFLIHTILQCLSAKTTSWNEFSSTMASAIICLATNQKFNFLRYILLSLVKNIEAGIPFFMVPRFVQLLIDHQLGDMSYHKDIYDNPSLTKNVFANMKRVGTGFSRVVTPLFDNMLVPVAKEVPLSSNDPLPGGRIIAYIDEDVEINLEEAQAKPYRMDLEHLEKVLSMQDVDDEELAKVEEVLDVVTTAKLITEVVTTARATTTAKATKVSVPRRRRGVVIQDPKKTTSIVVVHSEVQSKDKGKLMKYQDLKRKPLTEAQARKNMIIYLKNMASFKMNYFKGMTYNEIRPLFEKHYNYNQAFLKEVNEEVIVPEKEVEVEGHKREGKSLKKEITNKQNMDKEAEELKSHLQIVSNDSDDDVYTEATPLASKIPIVDYKIHLERNKPYFKMIRADGNHMLFLSFSTLLKNFNREDLESLWKLVKERFKKT
uniref:CCHC-type domain-containing protein n=1 Tax=Tanacetum cinerariifolium TaxID=118510 RepID=A0A6L2KGC3_TANCI|nr:hypothetical protein [Tanacetum cinerariifolium]